MAMRALFTLRGSAPSLESATAVRLRMPAVSISLKARPSGSDTSMSIASRVVPLMGLTMDLSSPTCPALEVRRRFQLQPQRCVPDWGNKMSR